MLTALLVLYCTEKSISGADNWCSPQGLQGSDTAVQGGSMELVPEAVSLCCSDLCPGKELKIAG